MDYRSPGFTTTSMGWVLGTVHAVEAQLLAQSAASTATLLYTSHCGHLSLIALWLSGVLLHSGLNGTYALWCRNPIGTSAVAHALWDPHFGLPGVLAMSESRGTAIISYSGCSNLLLTHGFR